MKTKIFLWIVIFWLSSVRLYAQNQDLDSLRGALEKLPADTALINRSIKLLNQYPRGGYYAEAIKFGASMLKKSDSLAYDKGSALLANRLGTMLANAGGLEKEALFYHQKALEIRQKLGDEYGIGISFNNIGNIYRNLAQDSRAIEYYLKSLQICEKIDDQEGIAYAFKNIALIYEYQNWFDKALEYHTKALKIREKISPNQSQHGSSLYNMAVVYSKTKQYDSALFFLEKALKICREAKFEIEDEILELMGEIHFRKENYALAFSYYQLALEKAEHLGKKRISSDILTKLIRSHISLNNLEAALQNLKKQEKLFETLDYRRGRLDYYYTHYKCDSLSQNELSALRFFKSYQRLRDSLFSETSSKEMKQAQSALALLQIETEANFEKTKQGYQENILISLAVFLTISVLGLSYSFLSKNKDNRLLRKQQWEIGAKNQELLSSNEEMRQQQEEILAQRDQIGLQKDDLSEANQQIQYSIRSALTIQQAVLPSTKTLEEALGEYFVLYRPKDVVSGDFYWINEVKNQVILVVADCTGHGVSGAFMSLIGINLLNRITNVYQIDEPTEILNQLQSEIRKVLRQDETNSSEGMDLAILTLEKSRNKEQNLRQIGFAGAKRPLFYCSPEKKHLVKGTRKSIGGRQNIQKDFELHTFDLPVGTVFYLFSDGFADQNDSNRNSFSEAKLIDYLRNMHEKPMKEQKMLLDDLLDKHSLNTDQRDDILVLGFRVS